MCVQELSKPHPSMLDTFSPTRTKSSSTSSSAQKQKKKPFDEIEDAFPVDSYADSGAAPVFTYKDFEFLPASNHGTKNSARNDNDVNYATHANIEVDADDQQLLHREPRRKPKGVSVVSGSASSKKAGPYSQQKIKGPPRIRKKGEPMSAEQLQAYRENQEKHKMMLVTIAMKRREQEEEVNRQLMKEELKRKKFKEALLERAMRSRQQDQAVLDRLRMEQRELGGDPNDNGEAAGVGNAEDGNHSPDDSGASSADEKSGDNTGNTSGRRHPSAGTGRVNMEKVVPKGSFMEPTRAYEAQMMTRRPKVEELDEEEKLQKEEEKYAQVAQIRRKFKEQNKQILQNIMQKKREADKKKEDEDLIEYQKMLVKKAKRDELLAKKGVVGSLHAAMGGGGIGVSSGNNNNDADANVGSENEPVDTTPEGHISPQVSTSAVCLCILRHSCKFI